MSVPHSAEMEGSDGAYSETEFGFSSSDKAHAPPLPRRDVWLAEFLIVFADYAARGIVTTD